jgi:Zn finger protein HypA/HybF involved in hydrogenase expression
LERDASSGLNPEALEFGFCAMSAETELAGVRLEWVSVDPTYVCRLCGHSESVASPPRACRICDEPFPRVRGDGSLRIRSIEVD